METLKISLKAARINAGLSQAELANMIGVSRFTLGKWETGKDYPDIKQVEKLEHLLSIPKDYIFFK